MDEVAVIIDGREWKSWGNLQITRAMDLYSTASFVSPFDPTREVFRETFRPFSYKPLEIQIDGEPYLTGTMIGPTPIVTPDENSVTVQAYALPGVMHKCKEPRTALPLEFKDERLRDIMAAVARPFGIEVYFAHGVDGGAAFKKVELEATGQPWDFLVDLAQQRNLVITSTLEGGNLLCWRSTSPGRPVARFTADNPPLGGIQPAFSPDDVWSEITGFGPAKHGRHGTPYTVRNPFLDATVLRPQSIQLDDTDGPDVPVATEAELARMFANAISYELVNIPTWRDPRGNLWEPNTTVTIVDPKVMIYSEYEFLIRSVTLNRNGDEKSATLSVVLPGAFAGVVPERLPWDEP